MISPSSALRFTLLAALIASPLRAAAPYTDARTHRPQKAGSPFAFTYSGDQGILQAAASAIEGEFHRAYVELAHLIGGTPSVRVHVCADGSTALPALYDPRSDIITIWAKWFVQDGSIPSGLSPRQVRQLTGHVIRHELAHLLFVHRIGVDDYREGAAHLPLWLLEGFAEWAAGGAQNACRAPDQVKYLFTSGPMDQQSLQSAMAVDGRPKTVDSNHKAYIQSFFMVKYLIGLSAGSGASMGRFLAFNRDLMHSAGQFASSLKKLYGVTPEQFSAGWTAQLNQDVILAPEPRLSNSNYVD